MYKLSKKKFDEQLNDALRQIEVEYKRKNQKLIISKKILDECKNLLLEFILAPVIFPSSDGSLQLEWAHKMEALQINMFEDKCHIWHGDRVGQIIEYDTSADALTGIVYEFFNKGTGKSLPPQNKV